jgi:hypothetical protein
MMNRARSIKDIGNIYLEMQKKVVSESNATPKQEVIQEAKVKATVPKDTFPRAKDTVKEPKTFKKGGPKNVKGLKKAKKNKKFSQKSKKITESGINNSMSIFDKLYEDVMKSDELDINTGIGAGPEGDMGAPEDIADIETDMDSDTPETPKEMLQQAIDLLQKAVDAMGEDEDVDSDLEDLGVEDSGSESEDMGSEEDEQECDSEEDESEEAEEDESEEEDEHSYGMKKETTDIKPLGASAGHQLQKGSLAAGNIKATTGKAKADVTDEVGNETGKHPMDHKSELTNPSKNKVGSLKTGKSLFDQ